MEYPLKHIRLQQLEEGGFNVADWICFPPNQLDLQKLRDFFEKHKRIISCRHFHSNEKCHFGGPFRWGMDDFDQIAAFCEENNREWWTLCNEFLRREKEGFTGNIILEDKINYTVEYWDGCESPRSIEHKFAQELKHFRREFGRPLPADAPEPLIRIASQFGRFLPDVRPLILEFNIYPYPVGRLRRNDVFWEWRQ